MNIEDKDSKRRRTNESMSSPVTPLLQRTSILALATPSQQVARKLAFNNIALPTAPTAPTTAQPGCENIKVFLRVRPTTREEEKTDVNVITQASGTLLAIKAPKSMDESKHTFTNVFPSETSQAALFNDTALPLVESFLQGHNGLLFAYGITNAGKTHTITGKPNDPVDKGLLPRMLDVIFNSIGNGAGLNGVAKVPVESNMKYSVWLSYYEIYNDKINDLLSVDATQKKLPLTVSKDENGKAAGIVNEVALKTRKDAEDCINIGLKMRSVAATALNVDSSRSHAMLTIRLLRYKDSDGSEEPTINTNKLSIVDLAGSERNQRTGTTGTRLKEAGQINNSLMTLSMCLETLRYNQQNPTKPHMVQFRNSKLTRCLQDYFLKESKVVMMVNINPCGKDYEETKNVLKFAAVASEITTTTRLDTRRTAPTPATIKKRKATDIEIAKELIGAGEVEEVKKERAKREEAEKEIEALKKKLGAKDESEKRSLKTKQDSDKEIQQLKQKLSAKEEQRERKATKEESEKDKKEKLEKDRMIQSLQQALEEQEMAIREEVAQEMAETICTLETQHRMKLAQELDAMEDAKLEIFTRVGQAITQPAPQIVNNIFNDSEQVDKYQKIVLAKDEKICNLETALDNSTNKIGFLEERVATLETEKDNHDAFMKAKFEQDIKEIRERAEVSNRNEIDVMRLQIHTLKRDKDAQLEEILLLRARVEELNHAATSSSSSAKDSSRTPNSKLQMIAKYGVVDQNVGATPNQRNSTTIWKGDVLTSVTGDGLSVTFTDVETLTPRKPTTSVPVVAYPPPPSPPLNNSARFQDPIQTEGLIMKEEITRSSWSKYIAITPSPDEKSNKKGDKDKGKKAKGKDKEKEKEKEKETKKKAKIQDEESEKEKEKDKEKEKRMTRVLSTRTISAMSKKLAQTLITPGSPVSPRTAAKRALGSPARRSTLSPPPPSSPYRPASPAPVRTFLTAQPKSPLSPVDLNISITTSPPVAKKDSKRDIKKDTKKGKKETKDKENVEATPVKGKRKLFDKSASEKGKFTEQLDDDLSVNIGRDKDLEKRRREIATPIARRLRPRKA